MKYLKIILFAVLFPLCSTAQSIDQWVIASQGDYVEAGSMSLSSTVGEVVVETEETPSLILTQGFQQSELNTVGIEIPEMNLSINAYPNPTTSEVVLELNSNDGLNLDLQIINTQGQLVGKEKVDANAEHRQVLDFSSFTPGVYFIQFKNGEGNLKSIKIEKMN